MKREMTAILKYTPLIQSNLETLIQYILQLMREGTKKANKTIRMVKMKIKMK
jgi:hypothetical protein